MIPLRASLLRSTRAALVLCVALIGLVAVPSASGHATLVGSDPRDGAALADEPGTVSIEFSEDVATPAQLEVTAPDGSKLARGEPTIDGATVEQTLRTSGLAGTYTMGYRIVSADGHPITGELTYEVTEGEQTESASADDEESFIERHGSHLAIGGVAVVVALGLLLWPWIRRRA